MNVKFFHKTILLSVLLLTSFSANIQAQDKDNLIIEPPLTWSINSIQIVWSVNQGATEMKQTKFIYGADQIYNETATKEKMEDNSTNRGFSSTGGEQVDTSVGMEYNPLNVCGLFGAKVNASAYIEGGFNYNQSNILTHTSKWSESEKMEVNTALQSAFEQNVQKSISDQKLVFTVDFINHTKTRLYFKSNHDNTNNTIPIYSGNTHLGDAHLVNRDATILATGKPIPIQFEMKLNDTGKQILVNNRPKIDINSSQLLIQSEDIQDAIQESIVEEDCFTVAIYSGNQVIEWKIRCFEDKDKAIKLQDALEAINKKMRKQQKNGHLTIFDIKDNHLVSVCNTPFTNDNNSKWITELNVIEGNDSHIINTPDSYLRKTPQLGDRIVFQLVNLEMRQLLKDAEIGNALAQYNLGKLYYYGVVVPVDKEKALFWINKAVEQNFLPEKEFLKNWEKENNGKYIGERKVFTVNGVEFAFRWCPPGSFTMDESEPEPGHYDFIGKSIRMMYQVSLTKGFWMMETEVTVGMFKAFVSDTGYESKGNTPYGWTGNTWEQDSKYSWQNPGVIQDDSHPVTCVSWNDAVEFCKWLSKKTGQNIKLPTEARWEYACRTGNKTAFFWGNILNGEKANCNGYYPYGTKTIGKYIGKTTPVGSYQPNAWGLYDMHGNVWEWCSDWYDDYPTGRFIDPTGPTNGTHRVLRGGSWNDDAKSCRSVERYDNDPDFRNGRLGFRCMMSINLLDN